VIDFGVARCVDATPEAMTALTDMGDLIGTVQYMSPEQFSANPADVDVRADVYALGVILYELLTGKPPYEIKHKQIFEAAKVVREQKPVSPAKLNQSVRPDLVRITGTCLHKDPKRRYASAAELAAAVGSYLGGVAAPKPDRGGRGVFAWASGPGWSSRSAVRRLAFGLPLLGIAAGGAWWLLRPVAPAPPAERLMIQFKGHGYGLFLEPATQAEAAERCREQGGYLARIETAAEHAAVADAALKSNIGQGFLWIAGLRSAGSGLWHFDAGKEPLSFVHRGIDRLNAAADSADGPCALAIAVDDPVVYWQPLDPRSQAAGFICEWNDPMTPQERAEP